MGTARLLDVAVREFGSKGPDGASTRSIAAAAGTVMSSITYHFGGKDGLYLAAADHVAGWMTDAIGDALSAEREIAADDPVAARAAIHRLLGRMAAIMLSEGSDDRTLFIVREQMRPTAAFDRLYAGTMGALLRRLADLTGIAARIDPDAARIVTVTLIGQVTALRSGRAAALRLLDREELTHDDAAALAARIAANTDAILDRLIAEQQGAA